MEIQDFYFTIYMAKNHISGSHILRANASEHPINGCYARFFIELLFSMEENTNDQLGICGLNNRILIIYTIDQECVYEEAL
jgi:hypothetical protein